MRGSLFALLIACTGALTAGCTGTIGDPALVDGGPGVDAGDPGDDGSTTADAAAGPDAVWADAGPLNCSDTGGDRETQVCRRWVCDTMDLSEGTWSGDVATCTPGDISADGRANALKLVNLYRFLAELPAVTTDSGFDATTQACALMLHANGALDHDPPMSWDCYTSLGASGTMTSNIATTPGVMAVGLYMVDPGNPTTIGHRRWILSNSLGPIGLGSTDGWSCMKVIGGSGAAGRPWTAWPAPGPFPVGAMFDFYGQSVDSTGWTVQSDSIDLDGADVEVVLDGTENLPINVTQLDQYYGATWALSFNPRGWTMQAGHSYTVTVTGGGSPITYTVDAVDCL